MHLNELNRLAAVGDSKASASRKPSRAIWESCPWFELQGGTKDGFAYFDDLLGEYIQAANVAATASTLDAPWCAFTDATGGATIASGVSPTDALGTMVLNSTTAQEGCHVSLHTALNSTAPIDAPDADNQIWLEARVKVSNITVNEIALFFGLMEVGRTITLGTIATGGSAAAAVDHVGFLKKSSGTSAFGTTHGNGTSTDLDATAGTFVADTYTNLGLHWDGAIFTFYQDGEKLDSTLALDATQFPAGESLAVYLGFIDGSGGGTNLVTFDWVKVAFERTA